MSVAVPVYYVFDQGMQIGPLSMPDIAKQWWVGKITRDALYCADGWPAWKPLLTSPELIAIVNKPQKKQSSIYWLIPICLVAFGLAAGYCIVADNHNWWTPTLPDFPLPLLVFGLFIYLLPSCIASKSPRLIWIFPLNLIFGWTGFVWIFCIVAAVMGPKERRG